MLKELLEEKNMTMYECSKISGIPYSTLSDIVHGKTNIERCSIETIRRLAFSLNVDIEYLLERNDLDEFETFKSNIKHEIKEKGDYQFMVEMYLSTRIDDLWNSFQKAKALYLIATLDYLSRINDLPISNAYDKYRKFTLSSPLKTFDVLLIEKMEDRDDLMKESIPEFARFNIFENNLRDAI